MAKKVAIIYQGAKYYGGIETYLEQLFANIDPKKVDLTLVSLGKWELSDKLKTKNEKSKIINGSTLNISAIFKLKNIVVSEKYDLLVSQGMVSNFYARIVSLMTGTPNLITIHSDYKFDFSGYKRYLYWLTFVLLGFVTKKYIVVSNFLKNEAQKLGVKNEKITVIYNGVRDVGLQIKNDKKELTFGSLGRLHYKKGYHNLIEAVSLLPEYNFIVKIWGEGPDRQKLEKLIRKYKLENKIYLMGFTKNISDALKNTDIYIQPSLEEGFGLTVAEAMLAGKPIIVTPAGSLPELITDGKNGLIADYFSPTFIATAMEKAMEDKNFLKKAGLEARKEALNRFGINKWVNETTKAYLEAKK